MQQQDREGRRGTFDRVALLYDRVRPGYPERLLDDMTALSGTRPGARVLEIGGGTRQASVPLAQRGYRVCGVERGANLAAVARRNRAPDPGSEVHVGAFEDWVVQRQAFDLAVSAQAFHWLDPAQAIPVVAWLGGAGIGGIQIVAQGPAPLAANVVLSTELDVSPCREACYAS